MKSKLLNLETKRFDLINKNKQIEEKRKELKEIILNNKEEIKKKKNKLDKNKNNKNMERFTTYLRNKIDNNIYENKLIENEYDMLGKHLFVYGLMIASNNNEIKNCRIEQYNKSLKENKVSLSIHAYLRYLKRFLNIEISDDVFSTKKNQKNAYLQFVNTYPKDKIEKEIITPTILQLWRAARNKNLKQFKLISDGKTLTFNLNYISTVY